MKQRKLSLGLSKIGDRAGLLWAKRKPFKSPAKLDEKLLDKTNDLDDENQLFLYLLPFKDGKHFKFGVSLAKEFSRVMMLHKIYSFDFNKAMKVVAPRRKSIVNLENDLKYLFKERVSRFSGNDGWTEVRHISDFENVLAEIKSRNDRFGFRFSKIGKDLKSIERSKLKKKKNYKKPDSRLIPNPEEYNRLSLERHLALLKELHPYLISVHKDSESLVCSYTDIPNKEDDNYLYKRAKNNHHRDLVHRDIARTPILRTVTGDDRAHAMEIPHRIIPDCKVFEHYINEVESIVGYQK